MAKKRILVICTGNSARSQMAEGFFRYFGGDGLEVQSAGTHPTAVNPYAIRVMKEAGVDISGQTSKSVNAFLGQPFDFVITVCDKAREECPYFPGARRYVHHSFRDPAEAVGTEEEILAVFRTVRDQIKAWVQDFLQNQLDSDEKDISVSF